MLPGPFAWDDIRTLTSGGPALRGDRRRASEASARLVAERAAVAAVTARRPCGEAARPAPRRCAPPN